MKIFKAFLLLILSAFLFSCNDGLSIVPGDYSAGYGTSLGITEENGELFLNIDVVGGNAHTCEFHGKIVGDVARGEMEDCVVKIRQVTKDSIETEVEDNFACGCGARVGLDYKWGQSFKKCDAKSVNKEFLSLYGSKKYSDASSLLQTFLASCSRHLFVVDADAMLNDLAISLYHEGKKSECLSTVKETFFGSTLVNLENYKEEFVPELNDNFEPMMSYYDRYKKLGPAIYYNYKLCK